MSAGGLASLLGQQQDAEVIDVRGMDFFLGYIPRSRRFPFELFDKAVFKLAAELAESGKVVVFIDKLGGAYATTSARRFARHLSANFACSSCKVSVLEGGFRAWESHFAGHQDSGRYVARAPNFPGAPYAGLFSLQDLHSARPGPALGGALPQSVGGLTQHQGSPLGVEGARAQLRRAGTL